LAGGRYQRRLIAPVPSFLHPRFHERLEAAQRAAIGATDLRPFVGWTLTLGNKPTADYVAYSGGPIPLLRRHLLNTWGRVIGPPKMVCGSRIRPPQLFPTAYSSPSIIYEDPVLQVGLPLLVWVTVPFLTTSVYQQSTG
jgi:hypothetical protein